MKKVLIPILFWCAAQAGAQTFTEASRSAKADLDQALREISALREEIEKEKIPLAKQLSELESEAIVKRKEAERIAGRRDTLQYSLSDLENRVEKMKENTNYMINLLRDYTTRFETQIHIGESQLYKKTIEHCKSTVDNVALDNSLKFKAQLAVLDEAFNRLEKIIGGASFQGQAVVEGGALEEGTFAVIGPLAYFTSSASGATGLATLQLQFTNAVVKNPSEKFTNGLVSLTSEGEGTVPVDATLGEAEKIERVKDTIGEHIQKGGIVMYPILGLFAFAILIAIFKVFEILSVKRARARDLETILNHLKNNDPESALGYAKSVKGPVGEMLTAAVEYSDEEKEVIEEVLYEKIITTQPALERFLPIIAVTAATAPLLGLLGTVTGMIKTFKLITVYGTGDAQQLSVGISEALITTEFGLIVAIPTLILHAILSRAARGVVVSMEQTAVGFINGIVDLREDQEQDEAA